jgi:hypothetical protein
LIRTEVITAEKENNFSRAESEARLSQDMLLKVLTWLETNTEVNYLFLFFITDFTDFTFFWSNHKYYLFNVLVELMRKEVMKW